MAPSPEVLAYNRRVIAEIMDAETKRRQKGVSSLTAVRLTLQDSLKYLQGRPDMPIRDQIQKIERIQRHYRGKYNR